MWPSWPSLRCLRRSRGVAGVETGASEEISAERRRSCPPAAATRSPTRGCGRPTGRRPPRPGPGGGPAPARRPRRRRPPRSAPMAETRFSTSAVSTSASGMPPPWTSRCWPSAPLARSGIASTRAPRNRARAPSPASGSGSSFPKILGAQNVTAGEAGEQACRSSDEVGLAGHPRRAVEVEGVDHVARPAATAGQQRAARRGPGEHRGAHAGGAEPERVAHSAEQPEQRDHGGEAHRDPRRLEQEVGRRGAAVEGEAELGPGAERQRPEQADRGTGPPRAGRAAGGRTSATMSPTMPSAGMAKA